MNVVFRNEKKFLINVTEFIRKSAYLNNLLPQDPHNGTHGYMIRSLYFDTVYDTDFFEKEAGIDIRRKIRLRIYDPAQDFAMLEMKQKQGENQLKRSLKISKHDAEQLIGCNFSPLLSYKEDFAQEVYGFMVCRCYRPKIIVEYNRKAFIAKENKIRITFDNNIISTESNLDLFSTNLLMNPVLDKYNVILEVKYNGFLLEYIKQMLNTTDKSELSVSKYCLARQNNY
ncbi:MAG: polyphosphate polymerase domain-containing protein [Eubacteriales bacterium]